VWYKLTRDKQPGLGRRSSLSCNIAVRQCTYRCLHQWLPVHCTKAQRMSRRRKTITVVRWNENTFTIAQKIQKCSIFTKSSEQSKLSQFFSLLIFVNFATKQKEEMSWHWVIAKSMWTPRFVMPSMFKSFITGNCLRCTGKKHAIVWVLLHNVDVHNVNVTGRVCYLT
jgi:hypothetical protein